MGKQFLPCFGLLRDCGYAAQHTAPRHGDCARTYGEDHSSRGIRRPAHSLEMAARECRLYARFFPKQNIGRIGFLAVETMVGRVGFEPTTNWLKASCSTD